MDASLDNLQFVQEKFAKTVTNTAVLLTAGAFGFTAKELASARAALITVEGDQIRIGYGTTPDATHGQLVNAGERITVQGRKLLQTMKMIRVTGDATLQVTLFK